MFEGRGGLDLVFCRTEAEEQGSCIEGQLVQDTASNIVRESCSIGQGSGVYKV